MAITFLLLLISSRNFHDVCQRFLYNQIWNFSWIRQKMRNLEKAFVFCRITLKFRSWLYKKRWHTSWKFQLEVTSNKKVIAKKPLTNLFEMNSTWRVSISFEEFVQQFEGLWREWGAALAFLAGLRADELGEVLHAVLVPFLGLLHPPLQHRLDLLGALRSDVQLLKPAGKNHLFSSTFSPPHKLSSAKFLFCFNIQSASLSLKVGVNVVWVSNSFDLGETPSYSASHSDPSCLHIAL